MTSGIVATARSPSRRRPRGGGFTNVELLVVIAIIAVLIALLVPAVQKVREAANRSMAQIGAAEIGQAVRAFFTSQGRLPTSLGELSGLLEENLVLGVRDGYHYSLELVDAMRLRAVGTPAAAGVSGSEDVSILVDLMMRGNGDPVFTPTPGADAGRTAMLAALRAEGLAQMERVLAQDQTGQTGAASTAYLCDPANISTAFNNLDRNGDGLVTLSEILSSQLRLAHPDLGPFLDRLRIVMQLGQANELVSGIPGVTSGDPAVICALASGGGFRRGDCDGDGQVTGLVTDAVVLLTFNFLGGREPPCLAACDANSDGEVVGTVTDAVYLLSHNFLGGPPPGDPFPGCGPGGASDLALGCATPSESCGG